MPGPCWWIMYQMYGGKLPTVKIGNLEMPIFPGRGRGQGWLLWLYLMQQQKQNQAP